MLLLLFERSYHKYVYGMAFDCTDITLSNSLGQQQGCKLKAEEEYLLLVRVKESRYQFNLIISGHENILDN